MTQNIMNICLQCGKKHFGTGSWCSDKCVDIYEGNAPRKPKGFIFGCDSPDKIQDPGHSYRSNEEIRVYEE